MNKKIEVKNLTNWWIESMEGLNGANPSSFIMKPTLPVSRLRLPTIYSGRCPQHTSTAEVVQTWIRPLY